MSKKFVICRKITATENKNKLKFIAVFSTTLSAVYRARVWATHFAWPRFDSVISRIEMTEFCRVLKGNVASGTCHEGKGKEPLCLLNRGWLVPRASLDIL